MRRFAFAPLWGLSLWGCAAGTGPRPDETWARIDAAIPRLTRAVHRADNDFSPAAVATGEPVAIPDAVQRPVRAALSRASTGLGPAYAIDAPGGRRLFVVRHERADGAEHLVVLFDPGTGMASALADRVSLRRSPADDGDPPLRAPFARFVDLDGDGRDELLMQGTWFVGSGRTSVVTRVFRIGDDLALQRVADFLTGDHFMWQKNPAGVWIVGDLRPGTKGRLAIDYVCHPLDAPEQTRPIGQVSFRYVAAEGMYLEDGARILDGHFSDFLRLDAK